MPRNKLNKSSLEQYKTGYIETNYDEEEILISFKNCCDKNFLLQDWNKKEDLKELNKCLKLISKLSWGSIKGHTSLYIKIIPQNSLSKSLPEQISKDETIYEMRVGKDTKKRIFGYREKNILYIIWFDLNHEAVPYHKNKR